jgi:hypothetical protein
LFGVSEELDWYGSASLQQSFPELNQARSDYLFATSVDRSTNIGGPVYRTWIYLAIGLAGALVISLASSDLMILGWGLFMFQILMQGLLLVSVFVSDYRFMYYQVVLGIVLAIGATSTLVRLRTRAPHATVGFA